LLIETLPGYLNGRLVPVPQDDSQASLAPTLKKQEGVLDFEQPAEALARKVRAFNPWPAAYTFLDGQPFKIHRAHSAQGAGAPGQRSIHEGLPAIATSDGLLVLDKVQPAGKQAMGGADFLHGARDWTET
jgi:methionyl-tRNA formyltransferase